MITQKLIEEIYKVATGETEIGNDDTDALAWIASRCFEEIKYDIKPLPHPSSSTVTHACRCGEPLTGTAEQCGACGLNQLAR